MVDFAERAGWRLLDVWKWFRDGGWNLLLFVPLYLWLMLNVYWSVIDGRARVAACKAENVYKWYICEALK